MTYDALAEELLEENKRLSDRVNSLEASLSNSVNADWHNEKIERLRKVLADWYETCSGRGYPDKKLLFETSKVLAATENTHER